MAVAKVIARIDFDIAASQRDDPVTLSGQLPRLVLNGVAIDLPEAITM